MTCIAAQQEKSAFLLKTLMLEKMLLFICSYHGLLSGIVPGPSLPRFLVWQAQTGGRTMTTEGFVGKGRNIPGQQYFVETAAFAFSCLVGITLQAHRASDEHY